MMDKLSGKHLPDLTSKEVTKKRRQPDYMKHLKKSVKTGAKAQAAKFI